jgi:apolipoprotein N-acyltransferase
LHYLWVAGKGSDMEKVTAIMNRYPRSLALIVGGISATGFAPLNLWPPTLVSLAVLMHLVKSADTGKRAFLIGWLFGMGHFTIGNNWIAEAFTHQDAMPAWLGWFAVPILSLYLALFPALGTWATWRIAKTPAAFILAFAAMWTLTEWLRSWVFTGFSWNPLSSIAADWGWLVAPIKLIGTYGYSGLILLAVGLAIYFIQHLWIEIKSKPLTPARIAFIVAFFIAPEAIAIAVLPIFLSTDAPAKTGMAVTIVQPNISQTDKYAVGYEAINFSRLAQQSRAKDAQPRLLLWPEAAIPWWLADGYPDYVYRNQPGSSAAETRKLLARLLGPDDILLTGTDLLEFDKSGEIIGARNSMLAINASGDITARYDKAHLVPYGEYLALRWLLEPLGASRLVPGSIDFLPGPGPQTLNLGKGRPKVGMQICYEIIFSGQVVDRNNRPDFIFNPSADAWFGSWGSPQFVAQSQLRAIEEGLPVIRSTPTGITAIIDANGKVTHTLPTGKAGRIDAKLPLAKAATLFSQYGNILSVSFALLLIALSYFPFSRLSLAGPRTSR